MPGGGSEGGSESGAPAAGSFADDQQEATTWVYGNGIEGKDAEVESYEFNKDDNGNYNFKWVFEQKKSKFWFWIKKFKKFQILKKKNPKNSKILNF